MTAHQTDVVECDLEVPYSVIVLRLASGVLVVYAVVLCSVRK
jgi:hypothetical protein